MIGHIEAERVLSMRKAKDEENIIEDHKIGWIRVQAGMVYRRG